MNPFLKAALQQIVARGLDYLSDTFIHEDFAQKYDKEMMLEETLVYLAIALANGMENLSIDDVCIQKIIQILRAFNVDMAETDVSKCHTSVDDFILWCNGFLSYEYDCRYRLMEAILFIFSYNGKNVKEYPDFIKLATFLELKKSDFIYLIHEYKEEKE